MLQRSQALSAIPVGLRDPLLNEYNGIVRNFMERKWSPSELSGGHLCEIVYTILHGHASGSYASAPQKPTDFVSACRSLEKNTHVPRSFQILIPRFLPALYEIRNNRGVGHAGGEVDPNHMDATAVLAMASWILSELIRVFHNVTVEEAQRLVDSISERRVPLVWKTADVRRVLRPDLELKDQILLLLASTPDGATRDELRLWLDYSDGKYFARMLRELHRIRFIEAPSDNSQVQLLPPGADRVQVVLHSLAEEPPPPRKRGQARRRKKRRRR